MNTGDAGERHTPEQPSTWRHSMEWDRKGLHLMATFPALWVYLVDDPLATLGLGLATIVVVFVDAFRLRSGCWATYLYRKLPFVFRPDEKHRLSGASMMAIGCTMTSGLYASDAATAGILCLTWGDTAAALTGQLWSRWRRAAPDRTSSDARNPAVRMRRRKTTAGSIACFLVSAAMILLVMGPQWKILTAGALVATLMERWTHGRWDNLTIPLATAGVIQYLAA